MENLELKISNYYNAQHLSKAQFEKIYLGSVEVRQKSITLSPFIKYAAIFVLILSGFYFLYFSPMQEGKILEDFAAEIAHNHQKRKTSKIQTTDLIFLKQELDELQFDISLPKRIAANMQLIGGQYCSVDNRIAAQLKLKNQKEEIVTCYIFKKEEDFDFDKTIIKEDVKVLLWNENQLIYAIAIDNE